ncbi:putative uncharacterized transmembrane protein DDB_G0290641 [Ruditapes philippinarum]|uniref:putative uncharacterized transmembrane protein DDB_G0290641 n=1 Tax=Ruditapes philippinarum TaxID=129788 RepID=UPI00295C0A62|nr:putative uncharacterized transmembrane protein DDB_G0290641 [Ruditapes philippinarum]
MRRYPARTYPQVPANSDRVPLEEMAAAEEKGAFSYQRPRPEGDDDEFVEAPQSQQKSEDKDLDWDSEPETETAPTEPKPSEPVKPEPTEQEEVVNEASEEGWGSDSDIEDYDETDPNIDQSHDQSCDITSVNTEHVPHDSTLYTPVEEAKAVTEPEQPQLGEDEMADLEKELELDLKNLDVNDAGESGETNQV